MAQINKSGDLLTGKARHPSHPITYGYARVSTREQNADRQLIAMRDFGVSEENIHLR